MYQKKEMIISLLTISAVSIFPAIFLYTYNAEEINFSEAVFPVLFFLGVGIILGVIGFAFTKSFSKSAIISVFFMLLFSNYAFLEKGVQLLLPSLKYWHVLPIFIFIMLHICYFIYKKMSLSLANSITKILCIVFSGLISINLIVAAPDIINKMLLVDQSNSGKKFEEKQEADDLKPNIYLLIFDEYSSFNMIKKCYNYDNSQFATFLEDKGFTVSHNSYNESIITSTVTTNLVNLSYIVDNTTSESEKEIKRHNGALFSLLSENGYMIKGVGNARWYGLEDLAGGVSISGAQTIGGETFQDILLQRSVIYPFVCPNTSAYAQMLSTSIEYLCQNSGVQKNVFTILHLLSPHTPFVVDENGNYIPSEHHLNWDDKQYYLGQYIYVTKLMTRLVDSIIKNDPDSIIILQSDHGARASTDPVTFKAKFELEDMKGILNAVYYRGEDIPEIKGQSGVNTLRIVFNRLFHLDWGVVEVPQDEYQY